MEVLLSLEDVVSDSNLRALRHMPNPWTEFDGSQDWDIWCVAVVYHKKFVSRGMGDGDRKLDDIMKLFLGELQLAI